jgi:hypothetical protein
MGVLQAQDFAMAKWAIGIRLKGYTDVAVEEAYSRGDILRTHVLRPTWHFVTPDNIRWMLMLSAEHIKSVMRSRDRVLEITDILYQQTNRLLQKKLEGGKHHTREALAKYLEKAKIPLNAARMTHFLIRAEADGIICSGAMRGAVHTYALLEERVPYASPLHREEALAQLARLYFRIHAPATLQDFIWWSGLTASAARHAIFALRTELIREDIAGQEYWMPNAPGRLPKPAPSAHLLPAYDEYIIAYRNRRAMLEAEHRQKTVFSGGIFRPVILVNGIAAGVWKKPLRKQPEYVDINYFTPQSDAAGILIHRAVERYLQFTGQSAPIS